jgi:hypothetical protein
MNKILISILGVCWLGLSSCSVGSSLDISMIQNSEWLYRNIEDCQEMYAFQDSTFEDNSCEIGDTNQGSFWIEKDTLSLLTPYPETVKIYIGGDSVEIHDEARNYRPTLVKMIYRSDTLFFAEVYHSYGKPTQRKFIGPGKGYLTRINK